jgi:hypothetical protein
VCKYKAYSSNIESEKLHSVYDCPFKNVTEKKHPITAEKNLKTAPKHTISRKKIRRQTFNNQSLPLRFEINIYFFSEKVLQNEDKTVLFAIINQNHQSENKL